MNPEPERNYIVQTVHAHLFVYRMRPIGGMWSTNLASEAQRFTREEADKVNEEVGGKVLLASDAVEGLENDMNLHNMQEAWLDRRTGDES